MLYDIPSELVARILRYTGAMPWEAEAITRDLRKVVTSKNSHQMTVEHKNEQDKE